LGRRKTPQRPHPAHRTFWLHQDFGAGRRRTASQCYHRNNRPPTLWSKLGHGYSVIIRAVDLEGADALQRPVSALFRDKGKWTVFAAENGRAKLVPVKTGRMNDERAELLGGVNKAAMVILHPSEKITDGARVGRR